MLNSAIMFDWRLDQKAVVIPFAHTQFYRILATTSQTKHNANRLFYNVLQNKFWWKIRFLSQNDLKNNSFKTKYLQFKSPKKYDMPMCQKQGV